MVVQRQTEKILALAFPRQLEAINDPARCKIFHTNRRAGKTECMALIMFLQCVGTPNSQCIFIAKTRASAKRIFWRILRKLDRRLKLRVNFKESFLEACFANGSVIQLVGADRDGWAEDLLGSHFCVVCIDEAAFYSIDLEFLYNEILEPTLVDDNGLIVLSSTPGTDKSLFFYRCLQGIVPGWSVHEWKVSENPYMADKIASKIEAKIARDPDIVNSPSFRRNYLMEWVFLDEQRVFNMTEVKTFEFATPSRGDKMIVGLHVSKSGRTGIVAVRWSETSKVVYIDKAIVVDRFDVERTAQLIKQHIGAGVLVSDKQSLTLLEQMRIRYQLPYSLPDKDDRRVWISLLSGNFATGEALICGDANLLLTEMENLSYEIQPDGSSKLDPTKPSELVLAMLHAYSRAFHFKFSPAVEEVRDPILEHLEEKYSRNDDENLFS